MSKILITGAKGFVGSVVCVELSKNNVVYGVDLPENDILEITSTEYPIDTVIHLAGIAHLGQCEDNPAKAIETNIIGTLRVLEMCVNAGVNRIIYVSSAYALGNKGGVYGYTKKACEDMIRMYYRQFGLPYTIVRCGSIYGVGSDENNQIYNLIDSMLSKKTVFTNHPEETREYIHVSDVAKAFNRLILPDYRNKTILLSGLQKTTFKELAETVAEIIGLDEDKLVYSPDKSRMRYHKTPYTFKPVECDKLILDIYKDFGAGLVEMIQEAN